MAHKKPSEVYLKNGRSLAECMPGKLEGAVVGGKIAIAPTPFNVVNSDGHVVASLSVSDLAGPDYDEILNRAQDEIPGSDINSVRERAAYVFEEIARTKSIVKAEEPPVREKANTATATNDDMEDEQEIISSLRQEISRDVSPRVDRDYSPMAALGLKNRQVSPAYRTAGTVSPSADIGPPQKLVYFEKEGIGTVPAFFHAVVSALEPIDDSGIEKSGFLVLIYDLRYGQNTARWFPPSYDPYGRPWAVKINDDPYVYLVKTTGFQYVYDNREHCVLAVERAVFSSGD
jgi:hypothetical protein